MPGLALNLRDYHLYRVRRFVPSSTKGLTEDKRPGSQQRLAANTHGGGSHSSQVLTRRWLPESGVLVSQCSALASGGELNRPSLVYWSKKASLSHRSDAPMPFQEGKFCKSCSVTSHWGPSLCSERRSRDSSAARMVTPMLAGTLQSAVSLAGDETTHLVNG